MTRVEAAKWRTLGYTSGRRGAAPYQKQQNWCRDRRPRKERSDGLEGVAKRPVRAQKAKRICKGGSEVANACSRPTEDVPPSCIFHSSFFILHFHKSPALSVSSRKRGESLISTQTFITVIRHKTRSTAENTASTVRIEPTVSERQKRIR